MSSTREPATGARRTVKLVLRLVVSLALSLAFLWYSFRRVDLQATWKQVRGVQPQWVLAFVASLVVIQICRIYRWDVLIRPFAKVSTGALWRISNVGLLLIVALPLRLGELGRPYLVKQESGAPLSAGLGAVAVERTIDGLLVTVLFFLTTTLLPAGSDVGPELRTAAWASLALFGGASVVIVGTLVSGGTMSRLLHTLGDPISERLTTKVVGMVEAFVDGLRSLPDAGAVARVFAYTLVYWGASGAGYYCVMRGFGLNLPPIAGFVLVSVLVLGIMIPAGPGFLGTFQAAIMIGLGVFGVGTNEAAAYGLVVYPLTIVVIFVFGLPYLVGGRVKVSTIVRASAKDEGGAPASPSS